MNRFATNAARLAGAAPLLALAAPAFADNGAPKIFAPLPVADGITFTPLLDGRLRYEEVDQPTKDAEAITLRMRAGFEVKYTPAHLAFLAEAQGNLAIDKGYDAFPYDPYPTANARGQYLPTRAVIADPEDVGLDRLQVQYRDQHLGLTVGRQRINLDDQRWVGSVDWRQNEQTFNAVRGEVHFGPAAIDATYADRQNSIYGINGGPREYYKGRFEFLGASLKTGPFVTKGFAYLLDYDPTSFSYQANSSQSYGVRSTGSVKLPAGFKLDLAGSYARQSSYRDDPNHFAATYGAGEAALDYRGLTVKAGYELMGADDHATTATGAVTTIAMQTPMATLHKFDGWADLFLTTPAKGLADSYAGIEYRFTEIPAIPGLDAQFIYHKFGSDIGSLRYGNEVDAALGFRTGAVHWLVKYANYSAEGLGTDTQKIWLQAEFSL